MLDINFLKKSSYFKTKTLQKNEVLFNEWEYDNNLYIIIAWEVRVEKYTTKNKDETKVLAILKKNEIIWEAALNSRTPKRVKISAKRETMLIYIDAREWITNFSNKYPQEWMNLLKYIIYISNERLSESNFLITANYKVSQEILKIERIDNKNIFKLIDKLEDIINIDYVLYLEKNPVLDNYLVIKYDSREKWKMKDDIIEVTDNHLHLLELKSQDTFNNIQPLIIWDDELWFLVYFRKYHSFNDNDLKILTSISTWISWLIKEKQFIEEEKNKDYMERWK